jgi:hypothetical protein
LAGGKEAGGETGEAGADYNYVTLSHDVSFRKGLGVKG